MEDHRTIVIFSGAGMSAESGIQTFRDGGGLWENHSVEDVATPDAWKKDPALVTRFYNERRKAIIDASPNEAHLTIGELESIAKIHVVTQNIDDLHERAGSTSVLHLHGNIRYAKSSGPNQESAYYEIDGWELTENDLCPDGYLLRPHVVWFGENVPAYEDAGDILAQADVVIVIGTSLQVHPAAGLIHLAQRASLKYIIDPNAESLSVPDNFVRISAMASPGIAAIIPEIKRALLNQ